DRVRVRLRTAVRLRERLHERLTSGRQLLVRETRDRDGHALRLARRLLNVGRDRREAVRGQDLHVRRTRPKGLEQLAAVVADQAAEEDALRPRLLDLERGGLVRRRLPVPRREAHYADAELLRSVLRVRRDAEAVGLLVVQDEELLDAELLRERRVCGTL